MVKSVLVLEQKTHEGSCAESFFFSCKAKANECVRTCTVLNFLCV